MSPRIHTLIHTFSRTARNRVVCDLSIIAVELAKLTSRASYAILRCSMKILKRGINSFALLGRYLFALPMFINLHLTI